MKKDITLQAIESFIKNSHFNLELKSLYNAVNDNGTDGQLQLIMEDKTFDFPFIVQKKMTTAKLPSFYKYLDKQGNTILISEYIPKSVKAFLREINISYLDTAGNAFITNKKGIYIYLETNKKIKVPTAQSSRAFSKSGLKVLYQILINETIVNKPYRFIGEVAMVSIDTVGKVFKELLRDKYLIQVREKEFKVQNKERLMQEWTTVFNKILRPKLKQRNFKPKDFPLSELLEVPLTDSIGGELAADFLTNHLIAERAIIYTNESFFDVAKRLKLIPATDGSITLVEKFWKDESITNEKITVNPILIYADLLSDPKPRNLETAKIIYDNHVKNNL